MNPTGSDCNAAGFLHTLPEFDLDRRNYQKGRSGASLKTVFGSGLTMKLSGHQSKMHTSNHRHRQDCMSIKDFHTDHFHLDRQQSERQRDEQYAAESLDPDRVADYLRQHPDFFIDYENLLPELALPHHTGEHAISLVERQVSVLRARNRDVRGRLNRLLETARDNDRLFQKTQKLVLTILDQTDADGIVDAVESSLRDDYQVDACALLLFEQPGLTGQLSRTVTLDSARASIGALLNTRQPTCGHLRPQEIGFLFADASQPVRSAAVVPIARGNDLLGLLAVGSFEADHYRSGMGTLFLTYLADVLNRALPRVLPPTD